MTYCDACGDRIAPDVPIERDGWTLTRREAKRDGERLPIHPQSACFLWMLANNAGRPISAESLGRRIAARDPDDVEAPRVLATVIACRIRKAVPDAPFETVYGDGYRWNPA